MRRRWILVLGAVALVLLGDAAVIEPFRIEVTHHRVPLAVTSALRIAHLSDLHTRGLYRRERRMLELLEREKPDVIVVTGDDVATWGTTQEAATTIAALRAPLGVWMVPGNWDRSRAKRTRREKEIYGLAGATWLDGSSVRLRDDVWLAGFSDGAPNADTTLASVPPEVVVVGLVHRPAYADRWAGRIPLTLAGHTHGGQVRLPLVPTFWLPRDSRPYVEGWYEKEGSRLYVSRGVGTSTLPLRFRCQPEIAIIDVVPPDASTRAP